MMKMFERVLLLAPHLDDVELGAGGLVARLSEKSHITYMGFYYPHNLRSEYRQSADILGINEIILHDFQRRTFPKHRQEILQILYDYEKNHEVDLVLTPATTDIHQDHQTITNEAIRAFRRSTILGYEIPGNNLMINQRCFVRLKEEHIRKKVEALSCYKSQLETRAPKFTEGYTRSRTINYGVHIKAKYAEIFEVIKLVII